MDLKNLQFICLHLCASTLVLQYTFSLFSHCMPLLTLNCYKQRLRPYLLPVSLCTSAPGFFSLLFSYSFWVHHCAAIKHYMAASLDATPGAQAVLSGASPTTNCRQPWTTAPLLCMKPRSRCLARCGAASSGSLFAAWDRRASNMGPAQALASLRTHALFLYHLVSNRHFL